MKYRVCTARYLRKKEKSERAKKREKDVHWSQPAMLPSNPLLRNLILITLVRETQLVFRVVILGQVVQNSQPFKDGKIVSVMVNDGGDPTVGVDFGEPGFFLGVFHNVDGLIGDFRNRGRRRRGIEVFELFEEDGDFVPVGGAESEDFDAGGGDGAGWFRHLLSGDAVGPGKGRSMW